MKRTGFLAVGSCLLFLPLCGSIQGQVSFFQPPSYSGTGALFVADFNGDGKLDILTGDGTMNLGNGDGTFTPGTSVSGGVLAVADFNGDGKLDVLQQGIGTLLVLLGNGDGTFQSPISSPSGVISLQTVAAGNLTGNGNADVVGFYNNIVYVYLSNGNGTFSAGVPYNPGTSTSSPLLLLAQFTSDGHTDVAVIPSPSGSVVVLLGNGDGTLQAPKTSPGVANAGYVATADFNGDGNLDLAISECSSCDVTSGAVAFLVGNGDGTFQLSANTLSGYGPIAAADVNGDGIPDLVCTCNNPSSVMQIFLGNGNFTFSNANNFFLNFPQFELVYPDSSPIAIADFIPGGNPDVAVANDVFLGNGDGSFKAVPFALIQDPLLGASDGLATGNFENTGTLDVAVVPDAVNSAAGTNVYLLHNNGSGTLSLLHTYTLQQPSIGRIFAADLRGDGKLDLIVDSYNTAAQTSSYNVLLGNGDGSFQAPVNNTLSGTVVAVADVNNDGKPDLIASTDTSVAILLGNGDGTFAAPVYYEDGGANPLLVADFNGDGNLDIAGTVSTQSAEAVGILYGNGNGTFQPQVFPPSLDNYTALATADFNNDGRPDLLVGSATVNMAVALNNGDGSFTVLAPILPDYDLVLNGIADFNNDGIVDLLVSNEIVGAAPISAVLLGNGDGTFGNLITVNPGHIPQGVIADMNGDGLPDIVFPWTSGVGVLLNTTQAGPPTPNFQVVASGLSPVPVVPGSSATSTVTVSPLNGFSGNVALSCTGLPSGASCTFNPASIPVGSGSSTVTVSTTSGLPAGTYAFTVTGTSGSTSRIASLSLTIASTTPDFQISATASSPASVGPGGLANSKVSIAALNGFTSAVTLNCDPGVSGITCSLNPSSVTPSGSTPASSTLTVNIASSVAPGNYAVTIFGNSGTSVHSTAVVFTVAPDFSVGPASGASTSQTISAGQTASFTLAFAAMGSFSGTVNLACAIVPAANPAPTCALSSSSVNLGSGAQNVTVSVKTTAASSATLISFPDPRLPGAPIAWMLIAGVGGLLISNRCRRGLVARACTVPVLILALALLVSCGGSSSNNNTQGQVGTPPGTYTATITATSGNLSHAAALQVVVQ
jgi:hypothetical protein